MGMQLFCHIVVKDRNIRPRFRSLLLNLILAERNVSFGFRVSGLGQMVAVLGRLPA